MDVITILWQWIMLILNITNIIVVTIIIGI